MRIVLVKLSHARVNASCAGIVPRIFARNAIRLRGSDSDDSEGSIEMVLSAGCQREVTQVIYAAGAVLLEQAALEQVKDPSL